MAKSCFEKGEQEMLYFDLAAPVQITVLGAGGTGGYIIPHLYRMVYALNRRVEIVLVDGDLVETKNLIRQNFIHSDIGQNKAGVLAKRYAQAFGMEAQYIPRFVETEPELYELTRAPFNYLSILIGAVDNNKSRKLCHEIFKRQDNLVYIDAGNNLSGGQVVCGCLLYTSRCV